jgi:hypothetical protein
MKHHITFAGRLAIYVPLATCVWGCAASLVAPAQWMVFGPAIVVGVLLGAIVSALLSVSHLP